MKQSPQSAPTTWEHILVKEEIFRQLLTAFRVDDVGSQTCFVSETERKSIWTADEQSLP